jgi:hypothetical protein
MKPMSAERCATEGLEALRANRAVYIPGLLNRIMNRLVPPSVAQKMEAKMLKKLAARVFPHVPDFKNQFTTS